MPTLILVRHGQSQWNLENRFTGWWDVDLTGKGVAEAVAAGELLADKGLLPDVAFTSLQLRAIKTLHLALEACGRLWIPETKDWRLNERHYGGLTGLDKAETAEKHGEEQVHVWRRSFDVPPPELEPGSRFDLGQDPRYAGIPIPRTESLKLTIERVLPYWESAIRPVLASGKTVLFVTHSVTEAVALSDAVVVMSATTHGVQRVIPVDLPRPRDELVETTAEVSELRRQVPAYLPAVAGGALTVWGITFGILGMLRDVTL